jgi:hypothetical protein
MPCIDIDFGSLNEHRMASLFYIVVSISRNQCPKRVKRVRCENTSGTLLLSLNGNGGLLHFGIILSLGDRLFRLGQLPGQLSLPKVIDGIRISSAASSGHSLYRVSH